MSDCPAQYVIRLLRVEVKGVVFNELMTSGRLRSFSFPAPLSDEALGPLLTPLERDVVVEQKISKQRNGAGRRFEKRALLRRRFHSQSKKRCV